MRHVILVLSLSSLLGCGSASQSFDASAPGVDAGHVAHDASAQAGPDGSATGDAGEPADAATSPVDAASAGMDAAPPGPDAGPSFPVCGAGFAGCNDYTDATAVGADRTITFAGGSYTPKCLKVTAGHAVTFSGSLSAHPLEQSCGPQEAIAAVSSGKTATYTLTVPGDYGYFCSFHGDATGSGMAGAIRVVP